MTMTREWRIAAVVGVVASLAMSFAFFIVMSPFGLKPGTLPELAELVAKPGFLGFVAGMFVSGDAHAGGPLFIVLAARTIVNAAIYTLLSYAFIRLFQIAF